MPEVGVSSPTAAACALFEHLPRVPLIRLCLNDLDLEVVWGFRDDLELCPELAEL